MKRVTVLVLAAIGLAGCASQQPYGGLVLEPPGVPPGIVYQTDPGFQPDRTWRQFHQTDPRFNHGMRDGG